MTTMKKRQCQRCNKPNAVPPKKLCPTCLRAAKKARLAKARDAHAQRTYGLKPGDLTKLDEAAPLGSSTCYICGSKAGGKLNTDHNHETGVVRGRLCTLCNHWLLGKIGHEDADRLELIMKRAIEYLQTEPAQEILKYAEDM